MENETNKTFLAATAIIALTVLESVALATGTDGALFLPVAGAIAGLGGYMLGKGTSQSVTPPVT